MTSDLCEHGMRGLVLSIAGLAWHGLGIDAGCPRDEMTRVLEYLRSREPMTTSQLLRGVHLKKEERDRIIACLEKENLIHIQDKVIKATSYEEFVAALYSRADLPEPRNLWANVFKDKQAAS